MAYQDVIQVLKQCEKQLRQELANAAQAGDYAAIAVMTHWAQVVAGLAAEAVEAGGEGHSVAEPVARPASTAVVRHVARASKTTYPRFMRTNNALVKIGWSKKSKAEYEHKAPLALARELANVAAQLGAKGKVFSIEELSSTWAGEESPPSYQHYVIVAWWRSAGLIDQHGRQGYSVPKPASFVADAEQRLDTLPH